MRRWRHFIDKNAGRAGPARIFCYAESDSIAESALIIFRRR